MSTRDDAGVRPGGIGGATEWRADACYAEESESGYRRGFESGRAEGTLQLEQAREDCARLAAMRDALHIQLEGQAQQIAALRAQVDEWQHTDLAVAAAMDAPDRSYLTAIAAYVAVNTRLEQQVGQLQQRQSALQRELAALRRAHAQQMTLTATCLQAMHQLQQNPFTQWESVLETFHQQFQALAERPIAVRALATGGAAAAALLQDPLGLGPLVAGVTPMADDEPAMAP
ncbi:hypothetical protein [Tahibacter amnicola]|uniref:Uncharacterized protein n=1 Tax=Tahibacter amnicola TaxID=2976241 RepID=A0ABY6BKM9_9GAMM|nr:hypothetical protein [Tahibacter amnicola]UXI68352.1 hypothetical protein N4264_01490 [Tahibacter amnicola]